MTKAAIVSTPVDAVALQPAPINPDWILEGKPVARVGEIVRSTDGTTSSAVWDCTAGTFNWYFGIDETVHILEGEVEVSAPGFGPRLLGPGDVALFRAGTTARWHVPRYVRKIAFCRHPLPWPMGFAVRALGRVKGMFAGRQASAALAG